MEISHIVLCPYGPGEDHSTCLRKKPRAPLQISNELDNIFKYLTMDGGLVRLIGKSVGAFVTVLKVDGSEWPYLKCDVS
jgi:hypothetical protein